ncbi:hypothetical protein FNV43_RR09226 [Rhamnella rubrinervis]|uniref:Uncharacterized protein n=1 Tax=Rhamnella rubrinervis TaxID=2594499 RepID=A0A8K0HAY0_9ROSA|nr:hypothetical protein FNV43_RR09226 [Rhamnella rubrinervis]
MCTKVLIKALHYYHKLSLSIYGIASRAEDNPIVSPFRVRKSTGRIILRVTISIPAPILKEPRQVGGTTLARITAILFSFKNSAWVMTPTWRLQLVRALSIDISRAFDSPTAPIRRGAELHGNIEPVHQRDVEEVLLAELVQRIFSERVGWLSKDLALQKTSTVTGLAFATTRPVEVAFGSRPYACLFGAWVHV